MSQVVSSKGTEDEPRLRKEVGNVFFGKGGPCIKGRGVRVGWETVGSCPSLTSRCLRQTKL